MRGVLPALDLSALALNLPALALFHSAPGLDAPLLALTPSALALDLSALALVHSALALALPALALVYSALALALPALAPDAPRKPILNLLEPGRLLEQQDALSAKPSPQSNAGGRIGLPALQGTQR